MKANFYELGCVISYVSIEILMRTIEQLDIFISEGKSCTYLPANVLAADTRTCFQCCGKLKKFLNFLRVRANYLSPCNHYVGSAVDHY
jgi:hypothetical protein